MSSDASIVPRTSGRAASDVDRQRQQSGVEHEPHDAVRGRRPADRLRGDRQVGNLRHHAAHEREVNEVPVIGQPALRDRRRLRRPPERRGGSEYEDPARTVVLEASA